MYRFGLVLALLASGCIERTASGDDPEIDQGGQDARVHDATFGADGEPEPQPPEPQPPEPVLDCTVPIALTGDPGAHFTLVRSSLADLAPEVLGVLNALSREGTFAMPTTSEVRQAVISALEPNCDGPCSSRAFDRALSRVEQAARLLDPLTDRSGSGRALLACMSDVARGLASAQRLMTAAVCGDEHGSARLTERFLIPAAGIDPLDFLCVTRRSHELCQVRYLDAESLTEPDRCPTCTVSFGETTCEVAARDTCGAAGECLCAAAGLEGDDCEFMAFGPRALIAFGEVCDQADSIGQTLAAGGFGDGGSQSSATPGCDWMPAVLEDRMCGAPDGNGCDICSVLPAGSTCEPGHPGCTVYIQCDQRAVVPTEACEMMGGLCPEGWAPVDVCRDDLPCEPARDCGVDVSCQPAPVCGDGQLDPDEGCDDGNQDAGDGCDANCQPEQP